MERFYLVYSHLKKYTFKKKSSICFSCSGERFNEAAEMLCGLQNCTWLSAGWEDNDCIFPFGWTFPLTFYLINLNLFCTCRIILNLMPARILKWFLLVLHRPPAFFFFFFLSRDCMSNTTSVFYVPKVILSFSPEIKAFLASPEPQMNVHKSF